MNKINHSLNDYVHDTHLLVSDLLPALPEGVEVVVRQRADSVSLNITVSDRYDCVCLIADLVPVNDSGELHFRTRATVMVNAMLTTTAGDMDKVVDSIVAVRMMANAIDRKFKNWKVFV